MDTIHIRNTADRILDATSDLPDWAIQNLLLAWDNGTDITKYNAGVLAELSNERIKPLAEIISDPNIDARTVYAVLAAGSGIKSRITGGFDTVEIVWTGPNKVNEAIRNTKPVIMEMLRSAGRNEKIIIVDYMITRGAESIVKELNSCLKEGVQVELIVDNNDANNRELRKCFSTNMHVRPTIYTRKKKDMAKYKIHAKTIIVGQRVMLIGSANLTGLGTEVNFELGLLVKGPTVGKMSGLIERMVRDDYFVKVEY